MRTDQIESLINQNPMQILTKNLQQVTEAIADSYADGRGEQIPKLVQSGKQLLAAVEKLG